MMFFLLTAVLIADGSSTQTSEERCDPHELTLCVSATPRTQIGLPQTKQELYKHCLYKKGQNKMCTGDRFITFLSVRKRKTLNKTNDIKRKGSTKDFLKEVSCWSLVSPDWSQCVDELQLVSRDISESSHYITYFNKNTEMCCAREKFVSCVGQAGRACSSAAGALLQRMAWVLAQDVATCSPVGEQPRAPCTAARTPRLSALPSLLYY